MANKEKIKDWAAVIDYWLPYIMVGVNEHSQSVKRPDLANRLELDLERILHEMEEVAYWGKEL